MHPDAKIATYTRAQLGLVTLAQALQAGLTRAQVRGRCRDGRWRVLRRQVYAVTTSPPSKEQIQLAAVLSVEGSVASHSTAADLWRMGDVVDPEPGPAGPIELTVVSDQPVRHRALRVHRTTVLPASHRSARFGVPVTSLARTLVDLSGRLPVDQLRSLADQGVRRGQLVVAHLRSTIRALEKAPGRRPTTIHEVLAHYDEGGGMTDSEREEWLRAELREAGFPDPVPQYRVRVGAHTYFIDLAMPWWMVGLEYDGWGAHQSEVAFHKDRERRRRLVAAGWQLVEVTKRTPMPELVQDLWQLVGRRAAAKTGT